ncbi:hypothetical protein ACH5RR_003573 [Cinchona calisaya]|uniref:GDSL esterase/lipase n=1 Tax=Cinchona calisaya TaxID=153742 RepID=A0ABD3AV66_9GENT
MATSNFVWTSFLVLVLGLDVVTGQPLVPALYLFGDSIVDVGNNNYLETLIKANFPPYGRDFINHTATGRFCNGKLARDFISENLSLKIIQNLILAIRPKQGRTSCLEPTLPQLVPNTLSLSKQLALYEDYQNRLVVIVGKVNASATINGSIHFLSAGSSDFGQKYYIHPLLYKKCTVDYFSDILIQSYSNFILALYNLGSRKIGVTTLPPIGCLPASIPLFSDDTNHCVDNINKAADFLKQERRIAARDCWRHLSYAIPNIQERVQMHQTMSFGMDSIQQKL